MTIQPATPLALASEPAHQFPDFPPRDDMQNIIHLHEQGHLAVLRRHFGHSDTTVVLGEVPIGWVATRERAGLRVPDLLIAFDVSRALIIEEMGYSISRQGKPPDFVLEIASPNTARNDEVGKRTDYARFGVPEYWRFDDVWGQRYARGLAGDRLVDGAYQPVTIHRVDENRHWGHSTVLNLDVCWEYGVLRWYDPIEGRYLDTFDEVAEGRIAERNARLAAEAERDVERRARLNSEARAQELEDEIRRLRGE